MKKHFIWTALDQAMVSGGNFLTIFLGAIYLPITDQGNLIVLLSFYFFCLVMSVSLVYAPVQSIYPKLDDSQNYIYTSFLYHSILSVALAGIALLALNIMNLSALMSISGDSTVYFIAFILLQQLADYGRRTSYVFFNSFVALCFSFFVYIPRILAFIIVQPADLDDVLIILVCTSAISAVSIAIYIFYLKKLKKLLFDSSALKQHAEFSRNIVYSAPMGWSVGYLPTLMLGFFSGPVLVGILGTLRSVVGLANFFIEMIEVSVIAELSSKAHNGQKKHVQEFFMKLVLLFSFSSLVILWIIFKNYELAARLVNEDFLNFGTIFIMLCTAYIFYFYGRMYVLYFRVFQNTKPELYYSMWSFLVVVLSIPVIYMFDITGSAMVYIIVPLSSLFFTVKKYKLNVQN
jgi:O-antigen/teichoic acid export membrane protein